MYRDEVFPAMQIFIQDGGPQTDNGKNHGAWVNGRMDCFLN